MERQVRFRLLLHPALHIHEYKLLDALMHSCGPVDVQVLICYYQVVLRIAANQFCYQLVSVLYCVQLLVVVLAAQPLDLQTFKNFRQRHFAHEWVEIVV